MNFLWTILIIQLSLTSAEYCHHVNSDLEIGNQLRCSGYQDLLRTNKINSIPPKISFSKNAITSIDSSSFNSSFSEVSAMYLDNNVITNVDPLAFAQLPNLKMLDLSYNQLGSLDPATFSSNKKVEIVNLTGNQIKALNLSLFQELPELKEFIISNNSLNVCDCQTAEALEYLERKKIQTYSLQNSCDRACTFAMHVNETNKDLSKNDVAEKFLPLVGILLVMLFLGVVLGYAVYRLFKRIAIRRNNKASSKSRTVSEKGLLPADNQTGAPEDGEGYLKPMPPQDPDVDAYGYLKPTVPVNPAHYITVFGSSKDLDVPLLRQDDEARRYEIPHEHEQYETDNVYEEVDVNSFYKRNLQMHLKQPYRRPKVHH